MSLKIMVVDDEVAILKLIKGLIEPLGIEVLTLADSREAADRAKSQKFDGVFVDVRMPNLDGIELTRQIRSSKLNASVPIVMLTAYDDAETMRQGFRAGATIFLGKPFTQDRLRGLFSILRGPLLKEKRRHVRLPLRSTVLCQSGETHFRGNTLNLSEGGILIEPSGGMIIGQLCDLEFGVPQVPEPLKLRAKVVRKEPPDRIALKFLCSSPETQGALLQYIAGEVKE